MKPTIAQKYRTQAIDLQPYGNTISVEAASDNPFESDQDVEIYTQASGGMAGPDPRMRSRGLLVSRPRTTGHTNGKAKTYRTSQDAVHNGFFPGMGDLDGTGRRVKKTRMIAHNGFFPGMGAMDAPRRRRIAHNGFFPGMGAMDAPRRRRIVNNGFFPGMGDVPPLLARPPEPGSLVSNQDAAAAAAGVPAAQPGFLSQLFPALTAVASTAGGVVKGRYDTQTAQAIAAQEQARADQMRSSALMSSGLMKPMAQHSNVLIGIGIAAAAAIGLAFILKRK